MFEQTPIDEILELEINLYWSVCFNRRNYFDFNLVLKGSDFDKSYLMLSYVVSYSRYIPSFHLAQGGARISSITFAC